MEVVVQHVALDAAVVRAWAEGALAACRAARERIDAVNVFPVPDADTGSNVALTVAGGAQAVARAGGDAGAAELLAVFAAGAARAARGSSGIILSQWLVGFADGVPDTLPPTATDGAGAALLVGALERAARAAAAAVPDPQEGTVLTVAREVAAHARRGLGTRTAAVDVLADAAAAARADLALLSAGHDVLRAARVVDAGACALLVVVDALVRTLRTGGAPGGAQDVDLAWLPEARADVVASCPPAGGGAYEVMMLVHATWDGLDGLAAALQGVGDAVAVVDAGPAWHAHVHCDDPAVALALVPAEVREQVVVRRVDEPAPAERGLVVLTRSPGLAAWYATCGAVTLVGGRTDAEQVTRAAVDTRAGHVVVVDAGVGVPPAPGTGTPDLPDCGLPTRDLATPDVPTCDVLAAAGDGPAVVACLALVADPQVAPDAGRAALRRLRAAVPTDLGTVPGTVVDLLRDAHDAQGLTLVHGTVDGAQVRAVADALGAAHPELEVVVAGPAVGPAWWVGVD
ncbi:DAK2 domain-containing protein [Cellulomonas sp. KH9]|uniref:DAK2 domain-containing protein n=1 Tax=Cellulomonas sp. KH9 TaxID=1855324 RepID=UPI0008ED3220|nr:DAK2 domain-containing protein [Cellulomonas sp. KH9]SFK06243.1 hypothetical protein SAMN05216467_1960 [Cellulomonas sp. KH9]